MPYQSVVKIYAKYKYSSYLRNLWDGSGTIISDDGLILTNAHLVLPFDGYEPDAFIIAMTEDPSSPPVEMFYADALLTDKDLDIAVLKISSDMNMKPVNWNAVKLPKASLGDSDSLQLGDPIMILGYPAIGGQTITLTTGNVGGFSSQKSYGDRAYIKTAATISGGTSGGMALDETGQDGCHPNTAGKW